MEMLRIVLLGKQGAGKSSAGNTLLGKRPFHTAGSSQRVTKDCSMSTCIIDGHKICVVDTPGWTDHILMDDKTTQKIEEWIDLTDPGPHVFLLVIPIGRFTKEGIDTAQQILEVCGEESRKYTMVLFTKGDDLEEKTIEEYLEDEHPDLKKILEVYGGRYHVFNNRDRENPKQVSELLEKIKVMVERNEGRHYTKAMYQKTAELMEEKWKEEKRIKAMKEEVEKEMSNSAVDDDETTRSEKPEPKPSPNIEGTVSTKGKEETESQQMIVGQNHARYLCNYELDKQDSNAMAEYFDQSENREFDEIKSQMEMQIDPEMQRMITNMMQIWFKEKAELKGQIHELQKDVRMIFSVLEQQQVKAFSKVKTKKEKRGSVSSPV